LINSNIPKNSQIEAVRYEDSVNMFAAMMHEKDPSGTYEQYQEYLYKTAGDAKELFKHNPTLQNEYEFFIGEKENKFSRVKAKSKNQKHNRR